MNTIECAFTGRVGTDPELRTSQAGKPWCRFTVAVGSDDALQWVQVAAFGETAETIAATAHKGDRIYCEGNLKLNTWTDKEGQPRSGLSVAAWKVEKLAQIGRNRPRKPQDGERQQAPADDARRDWQRPADRQVPRRQGADHTAIPF
jgi:single-strand DNA-binding protein